MSVIDLSEFDDDDMPEGIEEGDLHARIQDPNDIGASIMNPKSGAVVEQPLNGFHLRFHKMPMALKERLFFAYIELGDYSQVAAKFALTTRSVKALAKNDGWDQRAEELSRGLEKTLGIQVLENRRTTIRLIHRLLSKLEPERIVALLDGKDIVRLLTALMKDGGFNSEKSGLNINTGGGPTQLNFGGQSGGDPTLNDVSDEELVKQARELGIEVHASPRAVLADSTEQTAENTPNTQTDSPSLSNKAQDDKIEHIVDVSND